MQRLIDAVAAFGRAIVNAIRFFFQSLMWRPMKAYIDMVMESIDDSKSTLGRILKYPMLLFTPLVAIIAPFGIIAVVAGVLIGIDQALYPSNTAPERFADPANNELSTNGKVAMMFDAATNQMKQELDSTLGWCPNDILLDFFDNRCERQIGVHYATRELLNVLSQRTTRFGTGAQENKNTLAAREIMAYSVSEWGMMGMLSSASERKFGESLEQIDTFMAQARSSDDATLTNVRTDDLKAIIDALIQQVLSEPYARLTSRNSDVPWSQLDNMVYYAQGAAIVARDTLIVLRSAWTTEMAKGGIENLDAAIDSLDAATRFNPWWVARGDGDSMWADHRSKMQRYFSEAFRRCEELSSSIRI